MPTQAEIYRQVAAIVRPYLRAGVTLAELPPAADIRDYGIDSIAALEIFAEIERELGVRLGEDLDFSILNTLEAITALIVKKMP